MALADLPPVHYQVGSDKPACASAAVLLNHQVHRQKLRGELVSDPQISRNTQTFQAALCRHDGPIQRDIASADLASLKPCHETWFRQQVDQLQRQSRPPYVGHTGKIEAGRGYPSIDHLPTVFP